LARNKIALIGGGRIGSALALLVAERQLGDIVLLDLPESESRVKGSALDLSECAPLIASDSHLVGTSDWEDVRGADVAVITAGIPRRPGLTREDLLDANLKTMREVSENTKRHCPGAFTIVLTNPVDSMVYAFYKLAGLPGNRVVGMAGVLNTARYRWFVARELDVSAEDVHAIVLGGHGPTMVPLPRLTTVGGIPLAELLGKERIDAIIDRTREAGTEIVDLLGDHGPHFGPSAAALTMIEAFLRDRKRVLACSALCTGEYGVSGYFVGVPAVLGAGGVERILEVAVTAEERAQLDVSFDAIKAACARTRL
jgi:malate dehydrogenase